MNRDIIFFIFILLIMAGCVAEAPSDVVPVNKSPTAHIDSILPSRLTVGDTATFTGHGTDPDGTLVAYRWRSSIDGEIGNEASFDTSLLSEGEHVIIFQVKDDAGDWSHEVSRRVMVSSPALSASGC